MIYLAGTGFQWWNEGVSAIRDAGSHCERVYQQMLAEVITITDLADLTAALFTSITDPLEKIMFIDTVRGGDLYLIVTKYDYYLY